MTKRALISVSDKSGLIDFARELATLGWEILSTGGTASTLQEQGIPVTPVSDVTVFPEIMDGRVKTLHPLIHGAILADRSIPAHLEQASTHHIDLIDLVVVNLYPFEQTIRKPGSTWSEIVENIDIGGPAMVRSSAKNHAHVGIVVDPADYPVVINALRENGSLPVDLLTTLAAKAFAHTARYDALIAKTFALRTGETFPETLTLPFHKAQTLRYGENPHQAAAFYQDAQDAVFEQLHGLQLSYNNYLDIDAALKLLLKFGELPGPQATVGIIKHTNPSGIGRSESLLEAYRMAFATDTQSPYGGIVALNRPLDMETALAINEIFTEIIIAPDFPHEVVERLAKKKNRRLIRYFPDRLEALATRPAFVHCLAGMLIQEPDIHRDDESLWKVVTKRQPDITEMNALRFAWKTVALLKSNAVCFTTDRQSIGLGIGQTSRIDSTEIAVRKAQRFGLPLLGSVCGSDGFFPFRDSVDEVHRLGVRAIIQPGGSTGDAEVIAACDELDIAMIFTGMRHFRH
jgi:phosphoribosylaminoimidazolecarboxamide formyltransferase/IMP cyclohydrolase